MMDDHIANHIAVDIKNELLYEKVMPEIEGDVEYEGNLFHCCIYKWNDDHFVDIDLAKVRSRVLAIPNFVNNYPVYYFSSYRYEHSSHPKGQIEKIILGQNLVKFGHLGEDGSGVVEIVIPNGYAGSADAIVKPIADWFTYSDAHSNKNKKLSVISEDPSFRTTDQFVLAENGKELLLIMAQEGVIAIPEGVETIREGAFSAWKFKKNATLIWPSTLKKIEDDDVSWRWSSDLIKSTFYPKTLEYVSELTLGLLSDDSTNINDYPAAIAKNTLYMGPNVKEFSNRAVAKLRCKNAVVNNNFVVVDNAILSKDKTYMVRAIGSYGTIIFYVPDGVERINPNAFAYTNIKTIVLPTKNKELKRQFSHDFKVLFKEDMEKQKAAQQEITQTSCKVATKTARNVCTITGTPTAETVCIDLNVFGPATKKTFKITKECANIHELIIPEGVTDITLDTNCFEVEMKLEILQIPSTIVKLVKAMEDLSLLESLTILIINKDKMRWCVHKVPYALVNTGTARMRTGYYEYYSPDYDNPYGDAPLNEITYVKSFKREKLYEASDAYYYLHKKAEYGLLKVKPVDQFTLPAEVNGKKVTKVYDYAFSKFQGTTVLNMNPDVEISSYDSGNEDMRVVKGFKEK